MIVPYQYRATLVRVIDGDTVKLNVDLGFSIFTQQSCRLAGINTRELSEPGGPQAAEHLAALLAVPGELTVRSVKPDKFAGRFDGEIWIGKQVESVNYQMIRDGYAVPWSGLGPKPSPQWPLIASV